MSNPLMLSLPIIAPKKVPAKNAFKWMQAAWEQFKTFPLQWSGILLLDLLILEFMPSKVYCLIGQILCAGLFIAAWAGDQKRAPHINDYFAGFKRPLVYRLFLLSD